MDSVVLLIFVLVYVGMVFGRYPGLALDRTGIALLGAIALLVAGRLTPQAAWQAIDVSTLGLLLGLMVVSAQFRLGGFYTQRNPGAGRRRRCRRRCSCWALLVIVAGVLSALLANDIVCLAVAPVLVEGCARRRLNPVPFLLGLACGVERGVRGAPSSANPQNMLIGQQLGLDVRRVPGRRRRAGSALGLVSGVGRGGPLRARPLALDRRARA
jgi:Na+/H+ antiporter NhaD/arsenite permease-like protein